MPFLKRQGNCNLPIDQVRIDNCTEPEATKSKYVHGVSSGAWTVNLNSRVDESILFVHHGVHHIYRGRVAVRPSHPPPHH